MNKARKICLAVFKTRLASLFDNAPCLQVFEHDPAGSLKPTEEICISVAGEQARISALLVLRPDILICGGLSGCARQILTSSDIKVFDWVKGDVQEVLSHWEKGDIEQMAMPGCPGRVRHCFRRRNKPSLDINVED